ncbi:hypothetical protein GCM10022199_13980 [Marihabitans asiaticum]|uniref:ABC-2 family transporter n=1 Tax=Marihabitans asiaticum TaxID=415218 RepID=A0A560W8G9_9MICO|nr:ABC transporter permease subunit [Marihabitans asiaticum]TWD13908.1 ABC-2 family transporter [Marihabitans asiaticum]
MINAVKSELRKFFTTRLWWGMAIGIFVAAALFAALFALSYTSEGMGGAGGPGGMEGGEVQIANSVYTSGLGIGYLLLLTIGVMQIGSEYRHKTITGTFLSTPRRVQAIGAKIIALLVLGAVYGLISLVGSVAVGAPILAMNDFSPFPDIEVLRSLALALLALGLWALIGFGVGVLIPNQVAALLVGIGFAWIVEPLLGFGLSFWEFGREHLVKYFPSQATNAMVDTVTMAGPNAPENLSWWAAALVLLAWAAVLAGLGALRATRQDVA